MISRTLPVSIVAVMSLAPSSAICRVNLFNYALCVSLVVMLDRLRKAFASAAKHLLEMRYEVTGQQTPVYDMQQLDTRAELCRKISPVLCRSLSALRR